MQARRSLETMLILLYLCACLFSASLSDELVRLTSAVNRDAALLARLPELEAQLCAMSRRHDAALQVIGEKEEELQELRADWMEAKQMFGMQIQQLCDQITHFKAAAAAAGKA